MRVLYTFFFYLLTPFIYLHLNVRSLRQTGHLDHWRERLGLVTVPADSTLLWVHAASLGELRSASPLFDRLLSDYPRCRVLVTCFSASGRAWASAHLGEHVLVQQAPLDLPGSVARFLGRTKPVAAICLETEIWPNLYAACHRREIPIYIGSARLSQRSLHRYRHFSGLIRTALGQVRLISAQTPEDRQRFAELGADTDSVHVGGSFKLDIEVPDRVREHGAELKERLFAGAPVWLAASVREGEETVLADAYAKVRQKVPDCRLVMAPRHPEHARACAAALGARGIASRRRSMGEARIGPGDALILDTLGEMFDFLAAADIAFVGGSLVPLGGHNLLEPAALGLPILAGPSLDNVREIADTLLVAGALHVVDDREALASAVMDLLADPEARARARRAGLNVVLKNRGAVAAFMSLLEPCLTRVAVSDRVYEQTQ